MEIEVSREKKYRLFSHNGSFKEQVQNMFSSAVLQNPANCSIPLKP